MAPIGGIDMSYTVACCNGCGQAFASDLPPATSYAAYYRRLSKYDLTDTYAQIRPVDMLRARAAVALCAAHIDADCHIADIGCSVGHLLNAFHVAGWHQIAGIDPAPSAPACARKLYGLEGICQGTLAEAPVLLQLDRTKLVCLTGVLEHLWQPRAELEALMAHLRPGTLILIEVPALERFSGARVEPFGEFSLEHIQYFSETSLNALMHAAGATPVQSCLLNLGGLATDSLLALFRIDRVNSDSSQALVESQSHDRALLNEFVAASQRSMESAIARIAEAASMHHTIIIYGAGSHTARLLPAVAELGVNASIRGIVDSNKNLFGQMMGPWKISTPEQLINENPHAAVVVSSFRSQEAIAALVSARYNNPVVTLY